MKVEVTRGARAVIVCPQFRGRGAYDAEARLDEAKGLALAIGIVVGLVFRLSGVYWAVQIALWVLLVLGGLIVPALSGIVG